MLKYTGYTIAFQEVPNEISLVFNISGCTHHCRGCHSQYLWEDVGRDLSTDIADAIRQYADMITCVCFMGGDQEQTELVRLTKMCGGYKTCLYSGYDSLDDLKDCVGVFNYVKIGHYDERFGGLDKPTTNQRMYVMENGNVKEDITSKFRKVYK